MHEKPSFFAELKRRNVYKVAVGYAVVAWLLIQLGSILFPTFEAPAWVMKVFVAALALGFPIALILAWAFELTPEGVKRTEDVAPNESITRKTGRKLDLAIISVLLVAIALLVFDRFRRRDNGPVTGLTGQTIAVLPFANLSSDTDNAYFADGITDSLTTDLSRVHSLRVISYRSVIRYKGEGKKSLPEIARELNAGVVVEGSVQRSGDSIMINAQLVQATTNQQLWGERYTRNVRDLLAMQNEIVLAITNAVKVRLTSQEKTRLATARQINPEAQSHYFLGRFHFGLGTEAELHLAIGEYEQAVQKDPAFAAAHAGIASSYSALSSFYMAPREAMPRAEAAARKALSIDPDLAEAHSAIGYIDLFYHWDRADGERELLKAIESNPNYSTAFLNYALLLLTQSRFEEALVQLGKAQDLEPTSAMISFQTEWALFLAGEYRQALVQAQHTLSLEPNMSGSYSQMGLAYLYTGDKDHALSNLKRATEMEFNSVNVTNYAYGLAVSGQKDEAERILNRFLEESKGKYVCPYEIASAYEGMDERARALQWLERGYHEKCDCLVWGGTEPWMARFRQDPRYKAIVAKAGLLR